ncbi:MAG: hypothetical protein ACRYFR_14150 [Janthinobacterium lividum]
MMFDKKILAEPQVKAAFNGEAIPRVIEPLVDALNQLTPINMQAAIPNLNEGALKLTVGGLGDMQLLADRHTEIAKTLNKVLAVMRINGDINK